jgi:hypothetical protein
MPRPLLVGLFDPLCAVPADGHFGAEPQARQLGHELARFADRGAHLAASHAGLRRIAAQTMAVHRRAQVGHPAQHPARRMQQPQRQNRQRAKQGEHGSG